MKRTTALLVGILGIILTSLLLTYHIDKEKNLIPAILCGGGSGCHDALESRWSLFPPMPRDQSKGDSQTGIPVALIGLWHFTFITLWLIFIGKPSTNNNFLHWIPIIELFFASAIAGFFISIIIAERTFCSLCLGSHFCTFLLAFLFILMLPSSIGESPAPIIWNFTYYQDLKYISMTLILFLTVGMIQWQWITYEKQRHNITLASSDNKPINLNSPLLKKYISQKIFEIPIGQDNIIINPEGADYGTIVFFIDLRCQPCHAFHELFKEKINPFLFNQQLRIVYKHFPLCKDCNRISMNEHPQACDAAYLAEAARIQKGSDGFMQINSFFELTKDQHLEQIDYVTIARLAGLDTLRLQKDFYSPFVREKVLKDVDLAISLGVKVTPAVFLNGKRIESELLIKWDFWSEIALYLNHKKTSKEIPD